jgi:hypothetical protein
MYQERTAVANIAGSIDLDPGCRLEGQEIGFFDDFKEKRRREGRPQVLWGWKRDLVIDGKRHPESRTVYFSADLGRVGNNIIIDRAYFFLDTRADGREIENLRGQVGDARNLDGHPMSIRNWEERRYPGYGRLRMEVGTATEYDKRTIKRRLKGKPRLSIAEPKLVEPFSTHDISEFAPLVLCVGSGLSAESGLPLLGAIHGLFEVDNIQTGELVFGEKDGLPSRLVRDVNGEFDRFCKFTVEAVKAKPSESHWLLADLYKKEIIRQVFTDNMDDLMAKVGLPYTETRLSIFPDRFPAEFDPEAKALLVIGVAVDRRDVIKQARYEGLKIISVNPVFGVAPHSRNMDYLREGDIFFKEEANVALPKIISSSGF